MQALKEHMVTILLPPIIPRDGGMEKWREEKKVIEKREEIRE